MANAIKISDHLVQTVAIPKETSLGLSLVGGISRTEGPFIHIKDVIPGGDCYKDGQLRPGDQLVSVNKESLIGVSCEEAKSILNRAKLRKCSCWEISFIRPEATHLDSTQKQFDFMPKISSTPDSTTTNIPNQSGYNKEQCLAAIQDRSISDMSVSAPNQGHSRKRLISLNPDVQLNVEKLEMALNYLGINPTKEQCHMIRNQIHVDTNGSVSFGEFVRVCKNMFKLQLQDRDLGQDLMIFKEQQDLLDSVTSQVQSCDLSSDIDRLKRERDEAYTQLKALKEQLLESEKQKSQLSAELTHVKQEAKAAIEETRALRSRIHLAEVAQRQAHGVEMDYEEVIHLLEAEIMELKAQLVDHSDHTKDSKQDLRRRVTVLDCQLRKSEMARKTFEVSTEKLLQFVENVHEVLTDDSSSTLNLCERIPTFSSQIPRPSKSRSGTLASLAVEAKDLSRSVRSLVEVDCLPYGWEETYTADGIKYFINHVTETTSWTHPVTSGLSVTYPEDSGDESPRDLPQFKC